MALLRTHKIADNRGMSLVEVLVALAIFGIIVGPVCYSFVTTVHINNVSRQIEEATAAGSNLMEELKELDLNLIEKELSVKDIPAGNDSASKSATILGRGYDITVKKDAATEYGIYTLTSTEKVNKKDYLVRMELDPRYEAVTNPEDRKYTNYNDRELATLYSMSATLDGLLNVSSTLDDATAALFGGNILDTEAEMTRVIKLDIDKDAATEETKVTATVEYEYNGKTETPLKDQLVYDNKDPEVNLRNLYVFFNPLYSYEPGKAVKESIEINNPKSVPVNVLLIRMGDGSDTKDLKHRVNLSINEDLEPYDTEVKYNFEKNNVLNLITPSAGKLTLAGITDEKKDIIAYDVKAYVYLKEDVIDSDGKVIETELTEQNRQATIEGYKEKY